VYQYASNSTAIVDQTISNSTGTGVYTNYSQITQEADGANDYASVYQTASHGSNASYLTQSGSANTAYVRQR
jgi:hypothetical protein